MCRGKSICKGPGGSEISHHLPQHLLAVFTSPGDPSEPLQECLGKLVPRCGILGTGTAQDCPHRTTPSPLSPVPSLPALSLSVHFLSFSSPFASILHLSPSPLLVHILPCLHPTLFFLSHLDWLVRWLVGWLTNFSLFWFLADF